jgi:tetratricopeptide (TPR) repeat protein
MTAALLSLTRENALLWLIVLPVWMTILLCRRPARQRIIPIAAYAIGAALLLVPVAARNATLCGSFSLTTFQSGPNFYIGNGKDADGLYRPLVRGHETPEFERTDATELAQQAAGRLLSPREVSSYWWSRSAAEIGDAPLRWLTLLGRKALIVINQYEVPDVEGAHVYAEYSPVLAASAIGWHFGLLAPLGVLGVCLTWDDRRRLWLLYALPLLMAAAVAAFFVLGRYRYPLVAPLVIFAAVGVCEAWRCWRRHDGARLVKPLVATLLAAVVVNWPLLDEDRLDSLGWMNLGVSAAQQQNLSASERFLQRAVEGNPHSPEAQVNLGHVLSMLARDGEAIGRYERALELSPELGDVHFFAAQTYERLNEPTLAVDHYRRALTVNPGDAEAAAALDRLTAPPPVEP